MRCEFETVHKSKIIFKMKANLVVFFTIFVLVFVELLAQSPPEVEVTCEFRYTRVLGYDGYACVLTDLNLQLSSQKATVGIRGDHMEGLGISDVKVLQIINTTMNNFPANIFNGLPNIEALEVFNCGSFEFGFAFTYAARLKEIRMVFNNLPILPTGLFLGAENIEYMILYRNEIEDLGEAPFLGLPKLWHISLASNHIKELSSSQLAPLIGLSSLYISQNHIKRLESELFSSNPLMRTVHFEANRISTIGRQFLNNSPKLEFLGLSGNECVDKNFEINETNLEAIRGALENCFDRDVTIAPPGNGSRLTLELHGNLTIFDDNGDELLSVSS